MNKKATLAEKVRNFVEGKGFYVVVLVCVAAVGVAGWYLVRSMTSSTSGVVEPVSGSAEAGAASGALEDGMAAGAPAEIAVADTSGAEEASAGAGAEQAAAQATPEPVTEPETTQAPVEEPEPSTSATPLVFTWPVKGSVIADFSAETLLYDETMGDWRVHTGLDIAASQGSTVLACAAGTVSAVDQHDLMGATVVIDHGNGLTSTYANLQSLPTVQVGQSVYTGDIIGAVGTTAIAESGIASHLHFELAQDGAAVDPLDYLPAQ